MNSGFKFQFHVCWLSCPVKWVNSDTRAVSASQDCCNSQVALLKNLAGCMAYGENSVCILKLLLEIE